MSDIINRKNKINNKFLIFIAVAFFAFTTPSFASLSSSLTSSSQYTSELTYNDFKDVLDSRNYADIIIEMPNLIYNPELWENKFNDIDSYGMSLRQIAESYGGIIYINWPEYAHSKALIPNENYSNFSNTIIQLGFTVRNNTYIHLDLQESRNIIGLPYHTSSSTVLTGNGVTIAIIDTGINDSHPDFGGNISQASSRIKVWKDEVSDNPIPYDDNGHGTHVASIAAGSGAASDGMYAGIAPGAQLEIFKACYGSNSCDLDILASAVNDAVNSDPTPQIISLSGGSDILDTKVDWCTGTTTDTNAKALYDAVLRALNNNIIVVVSAGNEGNMPGTIEFPACINGVVAVGATHKSGYPDDYFSSRIDDFPPDDCIEIKSVGKIHAIVTMTSPGNPPQVLEKEWKGSWSRYCQILGIRTIIASGFQKLFKPNSWPATVRVQIETEHLHRDCYQPEKLWWDPGTDDKGDEFWTWEETFNYDSSKPSIAVEIGGRPKGEVGGFNSCTLDPIPYFKTYYNNYTCSGTAKICNSFDSDVDACNDQIGCYWCGCGYFIGGVFSRCYPDTPQEQCTGCTGGEIKKCYQWLGCHGIPKTCDSRHQENGETCGNPSATGCTASWNKDNELFVSIENVNGWEGLPAFFSSRGPPMQSSSLIKPLITAPGVGICAAKAFDGEDGDMTCNNNNYISMSGTSMATPMVSGLAALLRQAAPQDENFMIISYMMLADQKLFSPYPNMNEGYGRINATKALCLPSIENIDTNYDHNVDIFDMVTIATAYGTTVNDLNWNPTADINNDGIIDILDLVPVAINFGKTCQV